MTTTQSPGRQFGRRRKDAPDPQFFAGHSILIDEPFWDPVVVIPDPWRRDSTPTPDEIAERTPRFSWPEQTIADHMFTAGASPLVSDTMTPVTLASELATRVSATSTFADPSSNDLHLTDQLTATVRAMNLVPMPSPLTAPTETTASEESLVSEPVAEEELARPASLQRPGDAAPDVPTPDLTDPVSTVSAEDIATIADLNSLDVTADALETASAEIAEIRGIVSAALAAPTASADVHDIAGAVGPSEDVPVEIDTLLPAMAARLESAEERGGFDTARPPVRVAIDDKPASESEPATDGEPSAIAEVRLDRSSEPIEVDAPAPIESPEGANTAPADESPSEAAVPIIDALPEAAAAAGDVVTEVELPPANESTAPAREVETTEPVETEAAPVIVAVEKAVKTTASTVLAPAVRDEYNRTNIDFRRPWPRPKVRGRVIDFHCHLLARRHAEDWFEAADHYGMDCFVTMSPLEEAVALARDWGHRLRFIAVPKWSDDSPAWVDHWLNRIESFYNLGSRIAKFHAAPGTMATRGHRLDSPAFRPLLNEVRARDMAIMTHIGDPETWYQGHYRDTTKFGTRDEHYAMWESLLEEYRGTPWIGAHLGGNPEDLVRLQRLLDTFPDLSLDCSATRWMAREISARREPAREFFIRNADRILFGSDQVSGDDRGFDFLASRIWCHRKLWETAYIGESPIIDPDLPNDQQPTIRGLALPDAVLQKIYHDNATKLLEKVGMGFA